MSQALAAALLGMTLAATATTGAAPDSTTLARLLDQFLAGAGHNDVAVHERFWADDLIYTGSSGRRIGKIDIMRDVRSAPAPEPDDPKTVYAAEDVRIHLYDRTALVAFRLVATTTSRDSSQVQRFLNSGFFVKRDGQWRAVGWQATKMP